MVEPLEQRIVLAHLITVNSLDDVNTSQGIVTLRAAIAEADADPGSTIQFAPALFTGGPGAITLGSALPALSANVTITGPGASTLAVSGGGAASNFTVFSISSGVSASLSGMTIRDGHTTSLSIGAGIDNSGTLNLKSITLLQNAAELGSGGAIYNHAGSVTLLGSTVLANSAGVNGAGIFNETGSLTMTNSTVSGNQAGTNGGGISTVNGTVSLVNCTISGNTAQAGGGINNDGVLTLTNDTFTNNRSYNDPGGAIVTIGNATLNNTLVAGNFTGGSSVPGDINGAVDAASSYNLIGNGDNLTGITNGLLGNQIGTAAAPLDPKLGPLADNGGPTQTHALLAASPAIDGGNTVIAGVTIPKLDQRGGQRGPTGLNSGFSTDIGAYEATSSYLVTSTADTQDQADVGTIRGALSWSAVNVNANTANVGNPLPNTIRFDTLGTFQSPQTIQLAGTLVIGGTAVPQSIEGPGASRLTILGRLGTDGFRVLVVQANVEARLSGVTLAGGEGNVGGGIVNQGKLTVVESAISGNNATSGGGGLYNNGTLHVINSLVTGNSGRYSAGGIANYPASATLTVTNSVITGNSAGAGGGIDNQGTATIIGSTIAGNSAEDAGAGILNRTTMTIFDSTISGNTVQNRGGGVWNSGSLKVTNSTIAGNTAQYGGGIQNYVGSLELTNVTITNNRSTLEAGGGIFVQSGNATLHNTLIAGNFTGDNGTTPGDASGAVVAASSYNLIGNGDSLTGITNFTQGNKIGTAATPIDAKLGPLGNNGGPNETVALLAGSPALDGGFHTIAGVTIPKFDQRGALRAQLDQSAGSMVDIGAYEASSSFLVTTSADSPGGSGTLRTAVGWANANSNALAPTTPNTIRFDTAGVFALAQAIVLRGGTLVLDNEATPISIVGTGAASLIVSGNSSFRVLEVRTGTTATLSGLTITGGRDDGANGGGIVNAGTLTLVNSAVSGNSSSTGGGGIYNSYGTLTLRSSELVSNVANGSGGAIFTNRGTVTLIHSTLTGNTAASNGGAILNYKGDLIVVDSELQGNAAQYGGAIHNNGTLSLTGTVLRSNQAVSGGALSNIATATVVGSTFVNNDVNVYGAAIFSDDTLTVTNSTFVGNKAGRGGGIFNQGQATVTNATFTANLARDNAGGGISNAASLKLFNSLLAGNIGTSNTPGDFSGPVDPASSFNLIGVGDNVTGITNGTQGNMLGTFAAPIDAKIGVLADNGGPTLTVALLAGSPAIDAGANTIAGTTVPTVDQRGAQRGPAGVNAGATVDIGAFEASSSFLVTSAADTPQTSGTLRTAVAWANINTNVNPANAANPAANIVRFDTDGVFAQSQSILLTGGPLVLNNAATPVAIVGPGASALNLFAEGRSRVFEVRTGTTATLTGLAIGGGLDDGTNGGGVLNNGTLTIISSAISGNRSSGSGGGIFNDHGTLTIVLSEFVHNIASGNGGAILNDHGTVSLSETKFIDNAAADGGGAIFNELGDLTIVESEFRQNAAHDGGGIRNNGTLTLRDSTLHNNSAISGGALSNVKTANVSGSTFAGNIVTEYGGAIASSSSLTLTNSTLFGNTAGLGGGGFFNQGTATFTHVTVTGNRSLTDTGGGITNTTQLTLLNTIVARNFNTSSDFPGDVKGPITVASSYNLIGNGNDLTGMVDGAQGNQIGTFGGPLDPRLGPLADNGGPTQTVALLAGSPALGKGSVALAVDPITQAPLEFDQRGPGSARTFMNTVDIGAFEAHVLVSVLNVAAVSGVYGGLVNLQATLTAGGTPLAGQSVDFHFGAIDAGIGITNDQGVATVNNINLGNKGVGSYAGFIRATFAGSTGLPPSEDSGTLTITPAPLTVTANNASKVYGAPVPALTYTITGFVAGDGPNAVNGAPALTTDATASSSVAGSPYAINIAVGTLAAANYTFENLIPGELNVTRAPLTVTAVNKTMVYGAQVPTLTYTITGFVNGDTVGVVSGAPALTTTATSASHVQATPYAINVAAGTLAAANYAFTTFVAGGLTVTPAKLTITANSLAKVYGQPLPKFTAKYTGFRNGDTAASLNTPVVYTTNAKQFSVPGKYTITPKGASDPDYTITFVAGSLTVRQMGLKPDPRHPGRSVLVVVGNQSKKNDISVSLVSAATTSVRIKIGTKQFAPIALSKLSEIVVYGGPGDNTIKVAQSIKLPVVLIGGGGKSTLQGGGGNNVLVAGAAESNLIGGSKRDILIGGSSRSTMDGKGGGDVFIAGRTDFDRSLAALDALMAEWSSSHSYSSRVANLKGTGSGSSFAARKNGNFFLKTTGAHPTVHLTTAKSTIKGSLQGDLILRRKS